MRDIHEFDTRSREVSEKTYAAFLTAVNTPEITEPEFRYLAIHSALRILEGVEMSLKPEIMAVSLGMVNPADVLEPIIRQRAAAQGLTVDEESLRRARAFAEEKI